MAVYGDVGSHGDGGGHAGGILTGHLEVDLPTSTDASHKEAPRKTKSGPPVYIYSLNKGLRFTAAGLAPLAGRTIRPLVALRVDDVGGRHPVMTLEAARYIVWNDTGGPMPSESAPAMQIHSDGTMQGAIHFNKPITAFTVSDTWGSRMKSVGLRMQLLGYDVATGDLAYASSLSAPFCVRCSPPKQLTDATLLPGLEPAELPPTEFLPPVLPRHIAPELLSNPVSLRTTSESQWNVFVVPPRKPVRRPAGGKARGDDDDDDDDGGAPAPRAGHGAVPAGAGARGGMQAGMMPSSSSLGTMAPMYDPMQQSMGGAIDPRMTFAMPYSTAHGGETSGSVGHPYLHTAPSSAPRPGYGGMSSGYVGGDDDVAGDHGVATYPGVASLHGGGSAMTVPAYHTGGSSLTLPPASAAAASAAAAGMARAAMPPRPHGGADKPLPPVTVPAHVPAPPLTATGIPQLDDALRKQRLATQALTTALCTTLETAARARSEEVTVRAFHEVWFSLRALVHTLASSHAEVRSPVLALEMGTALGMPLQRFNIPMGVVGEPAGDAAASSTSAAAVAALASERPVSAIVAADEPTGSEAVLAALAAGARASASYSGAGAAATTAPRPPRPHVASYGAPQARQAAPAGVVSRTMPTMQMPRSMGSMLGAHMSGHGGMLPRGY